MTKVLLKANERYILSLQVLTFWRGRVKIAHRGISNLISDTLKSANEGILLIYKGVG